MTVGLICAIPEELTHLRANLDGVATVTVGHAEFATGTLDGHDVVLVGSGMGKVNAALVTTLLIDRFDCRSIAFSGIAGGLDPALSVGDVVIADRIVQCDAGMIHDERLEVYQASHVRFFNPTDRLGHSVDASLAARVRDRLAGPGGRGPSGPSLSTRAGILSWGSTATTPAAAEVMLPTTTAHGCASGLDGNANSSTADAPIEVDLVVEESTMQASGLPGANLAGQWSIETLRKKALLA